MDFRHIVDDDLSLRLFEPQHAEEIFVVVDANRQHLSRWLPWADTTTEPEHLRAFAESMLKAFAAGTDIALTILEHGKVVGGIGLKISRRSDVQLADADIGYWLAADAQRRGIMTRSVRAVTDYAFEQLHLLRLTIRAEPDNTGSCGVPRRLGWRHEGTMLGVCYWKGRRVDHELYALLAEEWKGQRDGAQINR